MKKKKGIHIPLWQLKLPGGGGSVSSAVVVCEKGKVLQIMHNSLELKA
ncbi:MAG: hypothetical protein RIM99_20465 [Cyclobacteriaceae bacterium]